MASVSPPLTLLLLLLLLTTTTTISSTSLKPFIRCLTLQLPPSAILASTSPSFIPTLYSSIRNLLFATPTTRHPIIIIVPTNYSHVQASVTCCRDHGVRIRTRSGGHDYEGLSYRSEDDGPFVILDMVGLRAVEVHVERRTAEVQAGATLGELYYRIAEKSGELGFPAGICPTVGAGGHISGGGFGTIVRMYGLASDNVLDARFVDVKGHLLDRASMGEDLFWAIRGGGGASFGIILSYTLNLVHVPNPVTVFTLRKTLHQGAIHLMHKWQYIAHQLPDNLFFQILVQKAQDGTQVEALFKSLFLGGPTELLQIMEGSFPDLGLKFEDCNKMSWVESAVYFAGYKQKPIESLLDRGSKPEIYFKAKSDFVTEPIPKSVFRKIWTRCLDDGAGVVIMDPYGGKMSRIEESETPFPHRRGVLYNIQYGPQWKNSDESEKRIAWARRMYRDLSAYVSKDPRAAYVNYRDLDLGRNEEGSNGNLSYEKAKMWGIMYFKGNFEKLARVKRMVDADDFFRNEQSVPPLLRLGSKKIGYVEIESGGGEHRGRENSCCFIDNK